MILLQLFLAGTDTTAAAIVWFIQFMLNYPEIQEKVKIIMHMLSKLHVFVSFNFLRWQFFPNVKEKICAIYPENV